MQDRFIDYIRANNLTLPSDSILLGVSGGIDSMVMLHLFQKSGFNITVAHCNFSLRGDEADADELHVKQYCLIHGLTCHAVKFDTHEYARENKLSIQVAARELRYAYFKELCDDFKYSKVAIAHNLNDTAETVLINLSRGTGIKGLAGIKAINGNTIRPLLFATRAEIEEYASKHAVSYREDSSNSKTKYKRNFIRHKIIPELRYLNPSVDRAIADTANHLQEAVWLVEEQLARIRQLVVSHDGDTIKFSVEALKHERCARFFMVEELSQFDFSPSTASAVVELLDAESGRRVESSTHTLSKDRDFLILTRNHPREDAVVSIGIDTEFVDTPIKLKVEAIANCSGIQIERDPDIALLNYSAISYPLVLRVWQPGDKFVPFGMTGFKKISDFLVDIKVPMHQKRSVYVLVSGDEIVWVVGYRIDNRFRIDEQTTQVLKLSLM